MDTDTIINGFREKVKGASVEGVLKDADETLKKVMDTDAFNKIIDKIILAYRYIRDVWNGSYTDYSKKTLALIVSGLAYLALPLDLVPDWIPVVGWLDDVVVLGWIFTQCAEELARYRDSRRREEQTVSV